MSMKSEAKRWVDGSVGVVIRRARLRRSGRPKRVEIGGGPFPTPGYIHVDVNRRHPHLEYVAPAWDLPFPDATVDEILAVHVLEHVHPARLGTTLREWRRVLAPGGFAQIHVPDGAALARAFLDAPVEERWAIGAALLGMDTGPGVRSAAELQLERNEPDHKIVFDADLLRVALQTAGFERVDELTGTVEDRHTTDWKPVVANISVIVRAWR